MDLLEELKNNQHKTSTKNNYYGIWKKFNEFVIQLDRIPNSWEQRVCLYCTHLICDRNLQSSTIRSYVSAIKSVLQTDGYQWEDGKVLLNVLTRSCKLKNDRVKTRLPIQKGLLEIILFQIQKRFNETQPYLEMCYISAYLLMYYGLMRVGEISQSQHSLKATNIHDANNRNRLLLVLYSSKTHGIESRPQKIKICGKTHLEVISSNDTTRVASKKYLKDCHFCPVEWTRKYIRNRPPPYG